MRPAAVCAVGVSLVVALLGCDATAVLAEGFQVELVHPQSDDQGRYVAFPQLTNATLFGVVAPAENVKAVTVNDSVAQLFPSELLPFGAPAEARALQFRATVALGPRSKVNVALHGEDGQVTRISLEPASEVVVDRLRELAKEQPDSARARCRLGGALRDSGRLEEAVDEFRGSLQQNMSCVNTRVSLGIALVGLGRPEEALKEFGLAAEAVPDYAMAWLNLGLAHARFTRNSAEAVRCFKRYLELEPNSSIADKVRRYIEAHS